MHNDLIVFPYSKGTDGIEVVTAAVIKGASDSIGLEPNIGGGNILAGDYIHDMLVYRVRLKGL